jgi:hypothetical protein
MSGGSENSERKFKIESRAKVAGGAEKYKSVRLKIRG